MTRDDIIRMAREAGMEFNQRIEEMHTPFCDGVHIEDIERFAAIVAAAEREACAKVCDNRVTAYRYATDSWAQEHIDETRHLVAAIRARGQE